MNPPPIPCPTCGYGNRTPGAYRCLRCRSPLLRPGACSGRCRACWLAAPSGRCAAGNRA